MRSAIILCLAISTTFFAQTPPVGPHGEPARKLAVFAPKPVVPFEARARHYKGAGVFMLRVRPDGTVGHVDVLQSTGHTALDQASIEALYKWRFIPGAVKNVKVPIGYTGNYPKG